MRVKPGGRWSAEGIGRATSRVAAGFAVLAAIGGLVKASGGSNVLAIAFATVGVIGAVVALGFGWLQQHAETKEERQALWRDGMAPALVRDVAAGDGIYRLGAETEAPEALQAAGLGRLGSVDK